MIHKDDLLKKHAEKLAQQQKESKEKYVLSTLTNVEHQLEKLYKNDCYEFVGEKGITVWLRGYGNLTKLLRKDIPMLKEELNVIFEEIKRAGYEPEIRFDKYEINGEELPDKPTDGAYLFIKF